MPYMAYRDNQEKILIQGQGLNLITQGPKRGGHIKCGLVYAAAGAGTGHCSTTHLGPTTY